MESEVNRLYNEIQKRNFNKFVQKAEKNDVVTREFQVGCDGALFIFTVDNHSPPRNLTVDGNFNIQMKFEFNDEERMNTLRNILNKLWHKVNPESENYVKEDMYSEPKNIFVTDAITERQIKSLDS